MSKPFMKWFCWFVLLFIIDFTIPYTLLKDVPSVWGSLVFWIVWGIIAILSMFAIFIRWHDDGRSAGGSI